MEIRIEGSDAVNDWDFWVYPAQVELTQGDVYTTDTLDAKAISILQEGGNVLITAAGKIQYGKEVKQYFTPVFLEYFLVQDASASYHRYLPQRISSAFP